MKAVSIIAACALFVGAATVTVPAWATTTSLALTDTGPATASDGQTINLIITVTNIGAVTATTVLVENTLPPALNLVSDTPAIDTFFNAGTDSWSILSLDSGASDTLILAVQVMASSGTIVDMATAIAENAAPTFAAAGINVVAATPLPATLPLFAGGLGVVGYLARRKKRKSASAPSLA